MLPAIAFALALATGPTVPAPAPAARADVARPTQIVVADRHPARVRGGRRMHAIPEAPSRPEPFTPQTAPAALPDLRVRLRATRWPDAPEDAGWTLGDGPRLPPRARRVLGGRVRLAGVRGRARPAPRFHVTLGGLGIHFVHARAAAPWPVLPLILCHGWPDSFWRYARSSRCWPIPPTRSTWFVPDIPGYEYSDRPHRTAVGRSTDAPAGLAAWITEKPRAWSDCGGDVERRFTKDEILTNVTIYWLTGTIGSSMRMYHANAAIQPAQHARRVEVPSGFLLFPGDIVRAPRAWLERTADLVYVTEPARGGHFAPFEEPELYAQELRAFFCPYRTAATG